MGSTSGDKIRLCGDLALTISAEHVHTVIASLCTLNGISLSGEQRLLYYYITYLQSQ